MRQGALFTLKTTREASRGSFNEGGPLEAHRAPAPLAQQGQP